MIHIKIPLILGFIAATIFSGCHTAPAPVPTTAPAPVPVTQPALEVQWMRQSVEYDAICIQTYRAAWQAVKAQAAVLQEDWAVVLDVDETVLDNSRYQEILYEQKRQFDYASWDEWVQRRECPPVPGAKAFLDSVRTLGRFAHIVYITNRKAHLDEPTRENLRQTGLWRDDDVLLCQRDGQDSKEARRQEVLNGTGRCEGRGKRLIIALVGDQLLDMEPYPEGISISPENFKAHYRHSPYWNTRYFMLPNPMYGYWVDGYK